MWVKHEKRLELPIRRHPAVSVYFRVWGERLPVADKLRTDRADRRDHGVGQKRPWHSPVISDHFRMWVTVWVRTKSRRSHAKLAKRIS
ncbi:hypothetical protein D5272_16285 [bacterium D16-76]|nr:hypothetical protein [bacterium D16-76]